MTNIRFSTADLEAFAAASHDVNPLHMSEAYAHRSPWGRRVVFGVLGVLRALASLPPRPGQELERVNVAFPGALFVNQDYALRIDNAGANAVRIRIADGARLVLKMTASFRPAAASSESLPNARQQETSLRREPAARSPAELTPGETIEGRYAVDMAAFDRVMSRVDLDMRGVPPWQAAVLLAQTYLVGMELPGRQALFSTLEVHFEDGVPRVSAPAFGFKAVVDSFDTRFALLTFAATISEEARALAQSTVTTFVRKELTPLSAARQATVLSTSQDCKGRVAVVTGASRGLGQAISLALVSQGATVIANYRSSEADMNALVEQARGLPGTLHPSKGDASDEKYLIRLKDSVARDHGGLDYLFLNAAAAIPNLIFDAHTAPRTIAFVAESLAISAAPLAQLIDLLDANGGTVVGISSSIVLKPLKGFAHYVAAKQALEGLLHAMAEERPKVRAMFVRPPRLLTDMTNSPIGQETALPADLYAAELVKALLKAPGGGFQELLVPTS